MKRLIITDICDLDLVPMSTLYSAEIDYFSSLTDWPTKISSHRQTGTIFSCQSVSTRTPQSHFLMTERALLKVNCPGWDPR